LQIKTGEVYYSILWNADNYLVVQVCKKVPQHIFIRKKQLLLFAIMHRAVNVNYYYEWQTDMGSVQELMGHGLDVEEAPMASGIDQNLTIDDWKVEIVRRR
jgi:hypothetical protein